MQGIVTDKYLAAQGEVSSVQALTVPKARQLAEYLLADHNPWAHLIEVRQTDGNEHSETVVFEVEVELSQASVHDIHSVERISVSFAMADSNWPEVLALRTDFPYVPHLNLRNSEFPRSLCLYEERYDEQKLSWAAVSIVERVRDWLRDTAAGVLHGLDQPLEPIFLGSPGILVLPADIFSANQQSPERLDIQVCEHGRRGQVFLATRPSSSQASPSGRFIATIVTCPPVVHGVIRSMPQTLLDLHHFTEETGLNLLAVLRDQVATWPRDAAVLNSQLVLVVALPKMRASSAEVEVWEAWAFVTHENLGLIGEALGLWRLQNRVPGFLIGGSPDQTLANTIKMIALNPMYALSRAGASAMNGILRENRHITAVGMGALGSQLTATLLRAGYGRWVFVDADVMLPHNAARHELDHTVVGWPKVVAMKAAANRILAEPCVEESIFADVLAGDQQASLENAFRQTDTIVDLSASVAVARHLCRDVQSSARRLSAFLNPSGTDLVVLAEDASRVIPLDSLEMQYYREVLTRPELAAHFARNDGRLRYARSCRDISSVMSEEQVALHAAIGARAVRTALSQEGASIAIWSSGSDLASRALHVSPVPIVILQVGEWTLVTDELFVQKLETIRKNKLPNETGGVLLGAWDLPRHVAYLVDTIPAPPDSEERKDLFIRGNEGLRTLVTEAGARTGGMIRYLGEWHSHPDNYGTVPSDDDHNVFRWLYKKTQEDGYPPVMAIVGQHGMRWFLGEC